MNSYDLLKDEVLTPLSIANSSKGKVMLQKPSLVRHSSCMPANPHFLRIQRQKTLVGTKRSNVDRLEQILCQSDAESSMEDMFEKRLE